MASQLEGVREAIGALNEFEVSVAARELRGTVKASLEVAEHRARANMPQGTKPHKTYRGRLVSPGFAISTLHIETGLNKRTGAAWASLGVGREAFYAVQFQELGTRFHAARPWLVPAFLASEDEMLRGIAGEIKSRVGKIQAKSQARRRQRARFY